MLDTPMSSQYLLLGFLTHGHGRVCWPAKTYIHQLLADTGSSAMTDGDGWQERLKGIRVTDITSWWMLDCWSIYLSIYLIFASLYFFSLSPYLSIII